MGFSKRFFKRSKVSPPPSTLTPRDPEVLPKIGQVVENPSQVALAPLQRYLLDIRRHDLLTPLEEKELATAAYENQDPYARQRLITANLRLVVKIAMDYRRAYAEILDLIQEGNAGLIQAVNRFNPYKGVKLSTYSAWWIRAYILKFLMDNKSLVRIGTTDAQRRLFFRLRGEAEKMYALTQRFDPVLLAESIGVKEQDVLDMQQRLDHHDYSLDSPQGGETGSAQRQVDSLQSLTQDPSQKAESEQMLDLLNQGLALVQDDLNDREKYILENRILSESPITLNELGLHFGITRERARQLEARLIQKIKHRVLPLTKPASTG